MDIDDRHFQVRFANNNGCQDTKKEENYYKKPWSASKIEEELVLHLCSYLEAEVKEDNNNNNNSDNTNEIIIRHPYQEHAKNIIYRINLGDPIPVFVIHESTMSPKLKEELNALWKIDKDRFNEIVTNSIKRVYESINYQYFHTSGIGGKISWAIVS